MFHLIDCAHKHEKYYVNYVKLSDKQLNVH